MVDAVRLAADFGDFLRFDDFARGCFGFGAPAERRRARGRCRAGTKMPRERMPCRRETEERSRGGVEEERSGGEEDRKR